jgi:hypothetical protein
MKTTLTILTLGTVIGLLITQPVLAAGRGTNKQFYRNQRICQGINSGELTRKEARHLQRQQHRLQRHQRLAWADGTLTVKERRHLRRERNRADENIYRLKNNKRRRLFTTHQENS